MKTKANTQNVIKDIFNLLKHKIIISTFSGFKNTLYKIGLYQSNERICTKHLLQSLTQSVAVSHYYYVAFITRINKIAINPEDKQVNNCSPK